MPPMVEESSDINLRCIQYHGIDPAYTKAWHMTDIFIKILDKYRKYGKYWKNRKYSTSLGISIARDQMQKQWQKIRFVGRCLVHSSLFGEIMRHYFFPAQNLGSRLSALSIGPCPSVHHLGPQPKQPRPSA